MPSSSAKRTRKTSEGGAAKRRRREERADTDEVQTEVAGVDDFNPTPINPDSEMVGITTTVGGDLPSNGFTTDQMSYLRNLFDEVTARGVSGDNPEKSLPTTAVSGGAYPVTTEVPILLSFPFKIAQVEAWYAYLVRQSSLLGKPVDRYKLSCRGGPLLIRLSFGPSAQRWQMVSLHRERGEGTANQ